MTLTAAHSSVDGFTSLSSSVDRRAILSSVSSSAMRRLAAASSAPHRWTGQIKTLVDPMLPAPVVDRLAADPQVPSDVGDLSARVDQVKNFAAELGRVAPSSHLVALVRMTQESKNETPSNWGKTSVHPNRVNSNLPARGVVAGRWSPFLRPYR